MEQRELIKDEIERLGKVLGKILSDSLGLSSEGHVTEGIEIANERFQSELDIDVEKLITLSDDDLRAYIIKQKLTDAHLEVISEYLVEVGTTKTDPIAKELYLKKAIKLLDTADEISRTFSFERMNKRSNIEIAFNSNI